MPWKKATSCAAPPDLDDENHAQAAYSAPVSASPPVMKPKSYASVAKASVVAAARPQPAAAPKRRVAASMPPADLKPSATACKLAADKVTHAYGNTHECAASKLLLHVDHPLSMTAHTGTGRSLRRPEHTHARGHHRRCGRHGARATMVHTAHIKCMVLHLPCTRPPCMPSHTSTFPLFT